MKRIKLITLIAIVILAVSCKKETLNLKTATIEKIINKDWHPGGQTIDGADKLFYCNMTNTYRYNNNGDVFTTIGTLVRGCTSRLTVGSIEKGSYKISEDGKWIINNPTTATQYDSLQIKVLTDSLLITTQSINESGPLITIEERFVVY
jgi:hypothetical protein